MTQYPRISIITPSYNQGDYIEETILSVLDQNYPNLQYIIIDGGSTDQSVEIIKKYADRLDYWVSEKDSGQSNAINKGLALADGDLVNWINSDDMLQENALSELAKLYAQHPEAGLIAGKSSFFSEEGFLGTSGKILAGKRTITFSRGIVNQPGMFYTAKALKTIGPLDENLHYCMDIDWWLKYLLNFDQSTVIETDTIFAKFRFHDFSKTISAPEQFKIEKALLYTSIFTHYGLNKPRVSSGRFPQETTLDIKKAMNYYDLWRSDELSLEGKLKDAKTFWKKVNPFKLIRFEIKRYLIVGYKLLLNKT